jgi:hypothetical protein
MAENKKSFIAYVDWKATFDALPDDKAGQLIKHVLAYVNDENPETDDILINAVFANIKNTLKRDLKRYENIVEKRSKAGKASAAKKQHMLTHVESVQQTPTLSTDSVNDNVIYKYIYSQFYDLEIENNKEEKEFNSYSHYVRFLFGENDLNKKLENWIKLPDQMSYKQYETLVIKARKKNIKISDKLLGGFNEPKYLKGKKSVYLTLNNWINRDEKRS